MKICAAQTRPIKGNIQANIENHLKILAQASSYDTDVVIFPELSLTGYEPELARDLAMHPEDRRLDDFQRISDAEQTAIGVGIPTSSETGICISMILFRPHATRQIHSKQYLHPDEEPFFVGGENLTGLRINRSRVALAICYEVSVLEHAQAAFNNDAKIYLASVAKSAEGVDIAGQRLSNIAKDYSMVAVMSNCVGRYGGIECAGRSAVWNDQGFLVGELDDRTEGFLIFDTESQDALEKTL